MVTDEEARRAASEILSGPDFERWYTDYDAWLDLLAALGDAVPDWLVTSIDWVWNALGVVFGWIGEFLKLFGVLGNPNEPIGFLAACLVLALFVFLGWTWWTRLRRADPARFEARPEEGDHASDLQAAHALARDGHYLEAAHRVQLATLALLIESDWLELARSDPNRTLRDRIRHSPLPSADGERLIELVDRLETLWFSEPRDDPGLFEDWLSLDERLTKLASGRAG